MKHQFLIGTALCSALVLAACDSPSDITIESTGTSPPVTTTPPAPPPAPPPEPVTVTVTLSGVVTDQVIPNAAVTASFGGETVSANADENGAYTLDVTVEEDATDAFVSLSAAGVGDQDFVLFDSLLGSVAALMEDAGEDGMLEPAENIRVNVTNLSTAEAALVAELPGGLPMSDTGLDEALLQVDPAEVLDLATLIKLTVDSAADFPLPEGTATTRELATNAQTRDSFRDDVEATEQGQDAFQVAARAIATDPDVVAGASDDGPPARVTVISRIPPQAFNFFNVAAVYEFDVDGSGQRYDAFGETTFDWELDGTEIVVNIDDPETVTAFPQIEEDTDGDGEVDSTRQVRAEFSTPVIRLAPTGARSVIETSVSQVVYPDDDIPDEINENSASARFLLPSDRRALFSAVQVDAGDSLAAASPALIDGFGDAQADVLTFLSGGMGESRYADRNFTWINEPTLSLAFTDGSMVQYELVDAFDDCVSRWINEITLPDGTRRIGSGVAICNENYAFMPGEIPARYYAFGIGEEVNFADPSSPPDPRLLGFRLRLDVDGGGAQEIDFIGADENGNDIVVTEDETTFDISSVFWSQLDNGDVALERTFDSVSGNFGCDSADEGCTVFDRRVLSPLTRDGDVYYWVEIRQIGFPEIQEDTATTYIGRFYEREPLDARAMAPARKFSVPRSVDARPNADQ